MTPLWDLARVAAPPLLAVLAALGVDRLTVRRRLDPPGFQAPWRRAGALTMLALLFWVGLFHPLVNAGEAGGMDFSQVGYARLFALQILVAMVTVSWYLFGFAGVGRGVNGLGGHGGLGGLRETIDLEAGGGTGWRAWSPGAQLGFRTPQPLHEIGLGILAGIALWAFVLCCLIVVAGAVYLLAGEDALPKEPPAAIPFIAGLPVVIRVLLALSAGVVEEAFFRGLLQPRVGILLSTAAFVVAHVAYGQPFMLVGITLLSLSFAFLVRWRQNLWPAIAAHAVFDAVQLLIMIPAALKLLKPAADGHADSVLAPLAACAARLCGFC